MKRLFAFLLSLLALFVFSAAPAESAFPEGAEMEEIEMNEFPETPDSLPMETTVSTARESFIEDIIALGEQLYIKANGKLQRAHYKGDIYVCKNFTVYLFRQTRDAYRMAEFPDTSLVIPNNLPNEKCKKLGQAYGIIWEDVPAAKGNPFETAAQFIYDASLSKEENRTLALEFMKQVKRGDYFQMSANYSHGTGAHSAIMISDYDPETNSVHWMDSNMAGKKINGIRYGKVQFDAVETIDWWVDAFCQKKRGATLYRLREDLIYAEDAAAQ